MIDWFSKGHGEESLALPAELQKAVATANFDKVNLSFDETQRVLIGCSRFKNSYEILTPEEPDTEEAQDIRAESKHQGQVISAEAGGESSETEKEPYGLDLEFTDKDGNQQPLSNIKHFSGTPESIKFKDESYGPDFSTVKDTWSMESPIYGKIQYEVFESKNKVLKYIFCRDDEGRAWIGSIECSTEPLNRFGLRQRWITAGALTTPAFEYETQLTNEDGQEYFDNNRSVHGYKDAYEKFLSKIPVIKEYTESVKART